MIRLAVALLFLAAPAFAAEITVTDGDTIRLGAERIRILGLDAPELHARCPTELAEARQARDYLRRLLDGSEVTIERWKLDRYGRTLARVTVQGRDVADIMIQQGLARPYHGERRLSWCE